MRAARIRLTLPVPAPAASVIDHGRFRGFTKADRWDIARTMRWGNENRPREIGNAVTGRVLTTLL